MNFLHRFINNLSVRKKSSRIFSHYFAIPLTMLRRASMPQTKLRKTKKLLLRGHALLPRIILELLV